MKLKYTSFITLFLALLCAAATAAASAPIARVTDLKGDAIVKTDVKVTKLSEIDILLYEGDMIQTQEGEVEITFTDGAVMKINPFTNLRVQEREEDVLVGFRSHGSRERSRLLSLYHMLSSVADA